MTVEARKLEHYYPHTFKVYYTSTNHPESMFQLSGVHYTIRYYPKPNYVHIGSYKRGS